MQSRPESEQKTSTENTLSTNKRKHQDSTSIQLYWKEFNNAISKKAKVVVYTPKEDRNEDRLYSTYTDAFFYKYKLHRQFTTSSKKVLQLGASTGKQLEKITKIGWSAIGYDQCEVAFRELQKRNITARKVDFNEIDSSGKLACHEQLKEDISKEAINILAIRFLQYLDQPATELLMHLLINEAAPGSVFIFAGNIVEPTPPESLADKENTNPNSLPTATTRGYLASFFAARTDIEIQTAEDAFANDAYLVAQKRM